jgi:hypothetical protein
MIKSKLAVLVMIVSSASAYAIELNDDETVVWQVEETYRRHVASGNVGAYVALWHDDFVGWPALAGHQRVRAQCHETEGGLFADPISRDPVPFHFLAEALVVG